MTEPQEEVRDFSRPPRYIRFRIDRDVFEGVPALAGGLLIDFVASASRLGEAGLEEQLKIFDEMFALVLTDASAARLGERLRSKTEPVELAQTMEIVDWLMERHGLRPPQPSEPSSPGSGSLGPGMSSTASAPPTGSISYLSPPPDSSTSSTAP